MMNSIEQYINSITDNPDIKKRWKDLAAKEIKAFAKRTKPFRCVKVSNYYLYIDTKTLQNALILRGSKPNAAANRAFRAPVNKFRTTPEKHVYYDRGRFYTTHEERVSGSLGFKPLDTKYYGTSGEYKGFFGEKDKKVKAYGIIGRVVVPVYSDTGFVEYISDENIDELREILNECFVQSV